MGKSLTTWPIKRSVFDLIVTFEGSAASTGRGELEVVSRLCVMKAHRGVAQR